MYITQQLKKFTLATLLVSLLILAVSFAVIQKAHAAEINPAPGTYSYGSTSEFSPYSTLGQSTPTPGTLAPTGQSQAIGFVAIVALLAIASGVTYYIVRSKKNSQNKL